MTDINKIASWMLLLTIVVTWTMKTSLTLKEKDQKPTHGRLRKNIFRIGFEKLKRCLSQPLARLKELLEYLKLLRRKKYAVQGYKSKIYHSFNEKYSTYFVLKVFFLNQLSIYYSV